MKLIVGLGNPGKNYEKTRHNIGFMFLDKYVYNKFGNVSWSNKFNSLYFSTIINGEKVIFVKPLTYMNLSGDSVFDFLNYYNIDVSDILIISDDLDLNIGNYKLKYKGSCGGHNGIRDIENKLKTQEFKRIKIGISSINEKNDIKNYVLGKLNNDTMKIYDSLFNELTTVLDDYFLLDFNILMSKYNKKNR